MKRALFPIDGLEDDAVALFVGGADEALTLQLSIAASLKRLADQGDAMLALHRDGLERTRAELGMMPLSGVGEPLILRDQDRAR